MALTNGSLGIALSLFLGMKYFGFQPAEILYFVVVANFTVVITLLATLQIQRFTKKALRTWTFLVIIFLGLLLAFVPQLRSAKPLTYLLLPLILSSGFGILAFGPLQDIVVRRSQRKSRLKAKNA